MGAIVIMNVQLVASRVVSGHSSQLNLWWQVLHFKYICPIGGRVGPFVFGMTHPVLGLCDAIDVSCVDVHIHILPCIDSVFHYMMLPLSGTRSRECWGCLTYTMHEWVFDLTSYGCEINLIIRISLKLAEHEVCSHCPWLGDG